MSSPARNSFTLWKGDTLRFNMSLKSSGSAYTIPAGTTFSAAVKEKNTTTAYDMSASIVSASAGLVLVTLSASTSALLNAKKNWIYDVQMMDSASVVTTLLYGNIFVNDEVAT